MVKNIIIGIILSFVGIAIGYIIGGALFIRYTGNFGQTGVYLIAIPLLLNWVYFRKKWLISFGGVLFLYASTILVMSMK